MIEIKHLYKRYGRFLALNDFSLNVAQGELFGFVGSNGAGKTTTMRICVGLLKADGGEVLIDGENMLRIIGRWLKKSAMFPIISEYIRVFLHRNIFTFLPMHTVFTAKKQTS